MAAKRRSIDFFRILLGERRLHLRASGAPIHRRDPVLSAGGDVAPRSAGPLRAAWSWLKQTDLNPDKGQFR